MVVAVQRSMVAVVVESPGRLGAGVEVAVAVAEVAEVASKMRSQVEVVLVLGALADG